MSVSNHIKIGIISALEVEYNAILGIMKHIKYIDDYAIGKIHGIRCVATISGIGYLAAQRSAEIIIREFKPKLMIFSGTAGSSNKKIKVGKVVVSGFLCAKNAIRFLADGHVVQYNVIQIKLNNKIINLDIIPGYLDLCEIAADNGAIIGVIGTSAFFTQSKEWLDAFTHVYHYDAGENEGMGFAYSCVANSLPFIVVRGISDSIFQPNESNAEQASINAANMVSSIISDLRFPIRDKRVSISDLNPISLAIKYGTIVSENTVMIPPVVIK
jgi:adenosylhomocysteine nucleosidase